MNVTLQHPDIIVAKLYSLQRVFNQCFECTSKMSLLVLISIRQPTILFTTRGAVCVGSLLLSKIAQIVCTLMHHRSLLSIFQLFSSLKKNTHVHVYT